MARTTTPVPVVSTLRPPGRARFRRLGVVAVVFFLLKGLFWLVVPGVVLVEGCESSSTASVEKPQ